MTRRLVIQLARLGDMIQSLPLCRRLAESGPVGLCLSFDPGQRIRSDLDKVLVLDPSAMARAASNPRVFLGRCREAVWNGSGREAWDQVFCLNEDRAAIALGGLFPGAVKLGAGAAGSRYTDWLLSLSQARNENRIHLSDIMQADLEGYPAPAPSVGTAGDGDLILHTGSGSMMRQLPREFWRELVVRLVEKIPGRRILLTGTHQERQDVREILDGMPRTYPLVNLCGLFSLDELQEQLETAALVIAQDTGVLHLAAHLKRPVIGLYHGSACVHETAPYLQGGHVIQSVKDCWPCVESSPDCDDFACRSHLNPEHIAQLSGHLLGLAELPSCPPNCEHWLGAASTWGLSLQKPGTTKNSEEREVQGRLLFGRDSFADRDMVWKGSFQRAQELEWNWKSWRDRRWDSGDSALKDGWLKRREQLELV